MRVLEVVHEHNHQYEGKTVEQVAQMTGKHPVDAFLDLALDEDLRTEYSSREFSQEGEKTIHEGLLDPYTHISTSDGGAHTRFQANARWPVDFLGYWIRDRELMTLEQAHHKMSAYPAWVAGYSDRGTLTIGKAADIMVYNLDELGLLNETPVYSNDFPGGERRLIQKPKGIHYILVNGIVTFVENECTEALPGKLLRSYDMAS
jgi:N-acyl-D-aspartate/D-glutamate deacylase